MKAEYLELRKTYFSYGKSATKGWIYSMKKKIVKNFFNASIFFTGMDEVENLKNI